MNVQWTPRVGWILVRNVTYTRVRFFECPRRWASSKPVRRKAEAQNVPQTRKTKDAKTDDNNKYQNKLLKPRKLDRNGDEQQTASAEQTLPESSGSSSTPLSTVRSSRSLLDIPVISVGATDSSVLENTGTSFAEQCTTQSPLTQKKTAKKKSATTQSAAGLLDGSAYESAEWTKPYRHARETKHEAPEYFLYGATDWNSISGSTDKRVEEPSCGHLPWQNATGFCVLSNRANVAERPTAHVFHSPKREPESTAAIAVQTKSEEWEADYATGVGDYYITSENTAVSQRTEAKTQSSGDTTNLQLAHTSEDQRMPIARKPDATHHVKKIQQTPGEIQRDEKLSPMQKLRLLINAVKVFVIGLLCESCHWLYWQYSEWQRQEREREWYEDFAMTATGELDGGGSHYVSPPQSGLGLSGAVAIGATVAALVGTIWFMVLHLLR